VWQSTTGKQHKTRHFGVHGNGPFFEDRQGNAEHHLRQAKAAVPGGSPHILVIGSGLWDGARLVSKVNRSAAPAVLPREWVEGYQANFTVRSFGGPLVLQVGSDGKTP
jgi:hypothetical protein